MTEIEPPNTVSADVELTRNKYLRALVILMLVVAATLPALLIGGVIFYFKLNDNQEVLLDCTDRRRIHSPCQEYQNERTQSIVNGPFASVVDAYVLCADRLAGDEAIKNCVANKLKGQD